MSKLNRSQRAEDPRVDIAASLYTVYATDVVRAFANRNSSMRHHACLQALLRGDFSAHRKIRNRSLRMLHKTRVRIHKQLFGSRPKTVFFIPKEKHTWFRVNKLKKRKRPAKRRGIG